MKAAAFDYVRPETIADAVSLLVEGNGNNKILAGGQSLGPMLNMRLVHTAQLVDISRILKLTTFSDEGDAVLFGACITHASIEDGNVPDVTSGMMSSVAAGIAYRAVRNRGTVGGSLAHADPAADWPTALIAIGAEVIIVGPKGRRFVPLNHFMESPFETILATDEIIVSVRIPKFSPKARWGFYKFCRKTGEFAEAMCAVVIDPPRDICRVVIGATDTQPVIISAASELLSAPTDVMDAVIRENGLAENPYTAQIHRTALQRAIEQVRNS